MIEIDEKAFTDALNRVAATDDGKMVLACIKEYCLFDNDIAASTLEATYGNVILRRVYLYLRHKIRPEHLKKIEFDYKRSLTNGTTTDSGSQSRSRATTARSDRAKQL